MTGQKQAPIPEKKQRDWWDKSQIILSAMIPLALFGLGYWGNHALQTDQKRRAYVELLSRREEADSNLRKDMFGKVIDQFVGSGNTGDLDKRILSLELLAYNFHDSIDMEPLLKEVYIQAWAEKGATTRQRKRLQKLAENIAAREVDALRETGCVAEGWFTFDDLMKNYMVEKVIQAGCAERKGLPAMWFRVDVLTNPQVTDVRKQTEVDVGLSIRPNEKAQDKERRLTFTASPFDFPMIDNVRLEDKSRVSVVMSRVDDGGMTLTLVYFPGSRTSLKDKPFFDEVLSTLD